MNPRRCVRAFCFLASSSSSSARTTTTTTIAIRVPFERRRRSVAPNAPSASASAFPLPSFRAADAAAAAEGGDRRRRRRSPPRAAGVDRCAHRRRPTATTTRRKKNDDRGRLRLEGGTIFVSRGDGEAEETEADGSPFFPPEVGPRRLETTHRDSERRNAIQLLLLPIVSTFGGTVRSASAKPGLVTFPCPEGLSNTYHLLRAGSSLLEEEDVLSTNPLFLTNREAALSDIGIRQVETACERLKSEDVAPTVVRYSLAASAVDSANVVGRELKIGRDRLVPEFNYMDPRALGRWNGLPCSSTEPAIWAMDALEAGQYGAGGRPPPNEDGTPNETLSDQVTRLTQLVSVLETQYSGDTILLIFPDGTGPALLSALMSGIPLNRVHELNFEPGEVRTDVTYSSGLRLLDAGPTTISYEETIDRGRRELESLRRTGGDIVDVKDMRYEEERRESEARVAREAKAREEADRAEREAILARKNAEKEARRERALHLEQERQKKREGVAAARFQTARGSSSGANGEDGAGGNGNLGAFLPAVGTAGVAATAALASGSRDDGDAATENRSASRESPTTESDVPSPNAASDAVGDAAGADVATASRDEAAEGGAGSTAAARERRRRRPEDDGSRDGERSDERRESKGAPPLGGPVRGDDDAPSLADDDADDGRRASIAASTTAVDDRAGAEEGETNAPAVLERNADGATEEEEDDDDRRRNFADADDDGSDQWLDVISELMKEEKEG